jgi:hypothetical protein
LQFSITAPVTNLLEFAQKSGVRSSLQFEVLTSRSLPRNVVRANLAERLNPLRQLFGLPATAFVLIALTNLADGQTPAQAASTTLTANPATVTVGASVTLNATVQPDNVQLTPGAPYSKPSGTITFLDGSAPLNATPLALTQNIFASQTFQQLFGPPSVVLTQRNVGGELTGDLNGDGIPTYLSTPTPIQS